MTLVRLLSVKYGFKTVLQSYGVNCGKLISDDLQLSVNTLLATNDLDETIFEDETSSSRSRFKPKSGPADPNLDPAGLDRLKPVRTGFVEDADEMTFQQQQQHLDWELKWTNSEREPDVFRPNHRNDRVAFEKTYRTQPPELLPDLPSAEAWSDSDPERTENRHYVHKSTPPTPTTNVKPSTTTPTPSSGSSAPAKQPKATSGSSGGGAKHKNNNNKTSAQNVPRTTAQPHQHQHHHQQQQQQAHLGFQPPSPSSQIHRHRFPTSPSSTPFVSDEMLRQRELDAFYRNYDPREGIVTAIVLGGFFVFVSLLVLYKTKCKPMWKNRRKRLTNTPVTHSVVEGDSLGGRCHLDFPSGLEDVTTRDECDVNVTCDDEDFGFECIPLQTVCNNDEDNDDIYFLDEFGNYVFPVSTPTIPGSCSCPPSAEDLAANSRRVSQVRELITLVGVFVSYWRRNSVSAPWLS